MADDQGRAAVGAGTTAGDTEDEEQAPESRAAEAAVDERLESLLVTGAALPDSGRAGPRRGAGHGQPTGIRPEQRREELRHNQAGIAGRLDRAEPPR